MSFLPPFVGFLDEQLNFELLHKSMDFKNVLVRQTFFLQQIFIMFLQTINAEEKPCCFSNSIEDLPFTIVFLSIPVSGGQHPAIFENLIVWFLLS